MKKVSKKKIKKKVSKKKIPEGEGKLNINRKRFCELYTKNSVLFGNATACYAIAFGFDLESLSDDPIWSDYDEFGNREKIEDSPREKANLTCRVNGSKLLTNTNINDYINSLLNSLMTNEAADAELAWVMQQRTDMGPKVQALREFNKLKSRITTNIEINNLNADQGKIKQSNDALSTFLKNAGDRENSE